MNSKLWIRKALSMCLMVALVATYSMVALASDGKAAGEIVVTGNSSNDETSVVTVNGEPAKSGRTIFSSSTISTPEGAGAIVSLGNAGRIQLAPGTTFGLSFDDKSISGDLATGSITVLSATQSVAVKTLSGEVVQLSAGETAAATVGKAVADHRDSNGDCVDDNNDGKKKCREGAGLWWAAILGGAVVAIVFAVSSDDNNQLGGGVTIVSPVQ